MTRPADPVIDVVILGGGPGGSSAGLTLLKRAGIRIAMIEASDYSEPRIGESLTPGVRPLLEYLGVWERFHREQTLQSFSSEAAWGSAKAGSLDYLFTIHGTGWALDRVKLDRMLADVFVKRGGELFTQTRFLNCQKTESGWRIKIKSQARGVQHLQARYLIDATGRRGLLARKLGVPRTIYDQLVGVACTGTHADDCALESNVLVEACRYGWWYTAPIPGNRVSIVLMSDPDIVRQLAAAHTENWNALLSDMVLTSERLKAVKLPPKRAVFNASSSCLKDIGGHGWVAIGDAATSHDPLSSTGIPHAIGSGTQGALVAMDSLFAYGQAQAALQETVQSDYMQYLRTHWQYYQRESRWPDDNFWKRRQTVVSLSPDAILSNALNLSSDTAYDSIYLPKGIAHDLQTYLRPGRSAETIVREISQAHPEISDQRIILGLQEVLSQNQHFLQ